MILFPRKQHVVRLSVTVAPDLAEYVRATAAADGVPLSAVVVTALRRQQREERNRRIRQERIADSEEEQALAAEAAR